MRNVAESIAIPPVKKIAPNQGDRYTRYWAAFVPYRFSTKVPTATVVPIAAISEIPNQMLPQRCIRRQMRAWSGSSERAPAGRGAWRSSVAAVPRNPAAITIAAAPAGPRGSKSPGSGPSFGTVEPRDGEREGQREAGVARQEPPARMAAPLGRDGGQEAERERGRHRAREECHPVGRAPRAVREAREVEGDDARGDVDDEEEREEARGTGVMCPFGAVKSPAARRGGRAASDAVDGAGFT